MAGVLIRDQPPDNPPSARVEGYRLDSPTLPVLYASQAVEVSSMSAEVQSYRRRRSILSSRAIAERRKEHGFDGVIYPSYFSMVRLGVAPFDTNYGLSLRHHVDGYGKAETIENLGLFGRPIEAGLIEVKCTNRLLLTKIKYEREFGPVF
jgi:hypothetical protein